MQNLTPMLDQEAELYHDIQKKLRAYFHVLDDLNRETKRDLDYRPLSVQINRDMRAIQGFSQILDRHAKYSLIYKQIEGEILEKQRKRKKKKEEADALKKNPKSKKDFNERNDYYGQDDQDDQDDEI